MVTQGRGERDNNFDLIRILAALGVLVSHSFALVGQAEPGLRGLNLGNACVLVFFGASGYLVTASWLRDPNLARFLWKRFARIYPALVVVLILTVGAIGPLMTSHSLGAYLQASSTLLYVPENLLMWRTAFELPGVFLENPLPGAVNGSLWTLRSEVHAYGLLAALGAAGLLLRTRTALTVLGAVAVCCVAAPETVTRFATSWLLLGFCCGAAFYIARTWVPLRWFAAAAGLLLWAIAPLDAEALKYLAAVVVPYVTLTAAYELPPVARFLRDRDLSYGTYLWAFPIQQLIVSISPTVRAWELVTLSAVLTLPVAAASWFVVERRAATWRPPWLGSRPERATERTAA